jgi:hypothetical protein
MRKEHDGGNEPEAGYPRAQPQRRLPPRVVQGTRPGWRGIQRERADTGQTQEQRHGQRNAAAREPQGHTGNQRNEYGAFAHAENETAQPHEFVGRSHGREYGANEADEGGPQRHAGRPEAIDEQSVDEGQRDVRQADDGGQIADLRLREAALAPQ